MSMESLYSYIDSVFDSIRAAQADHKSVSEQLNIVRIKGRQQRRVKEQFAASTYIEYKIQRLLSTEITLGYQYNGDMYCTHKNLVPTCKSTNELHKLNLTQDQWDSLPKFHIWVRSGKVYGKC